MSAISSLPLLTDAVRVPFVSVIMNCYNSARYLREALDSVLAQTFADWEIVFWDNQSADESAAIFKSYPDSRFRYFLAPEHTTLGRARNLAVEQARGEWIAFLDCDDLWLPEKLGKQVALIFDAGPELGLVYGRSQSLVEGSGLQTSMGRRMQAYEQRGGRLLPEGNIFPDLLKENFVPLLSGMVRRSAYWSVGGIDPVFRQAEDYDLFVKISKVFAARVVQEKVCTYRIHGSNLSHAQAEDNYWEAIAIVSRYLPMPEAQRGIRSHQTSFAADEIRQGRILDGLKRVMARGDVALFTSKLVKYVWWYFIYSILSFIKMNKSGLACRNSRSSGAGADRK